MSERSRGPLWLQDETYDITARIPPGSAKEQVKLMLQKANGCRKRSDPFEIGGMVASTQGPEAGVWVIAETTDVPTRYIKEVVTDDRGRYLVPDLPSAAYTVWARG